MFARLTLCAAAAALTFALIGSAAAPAAKPEAFAIDPVHSTVIFRCTHLGASYAFGRFDKVEGSFDFDAEKPETSKVMVTIDTASLNTANADRDEHLRGTDFLDVKQFPAAKFTSTAVKKKGDKVYTVTGDLELHGTKKSVSFDMQHIGSANHAIAGSVTGFYGELDLQRMDYGISYAPDDLGKTIKLLISIEGAKKK